MRSSIASLDSLASSTLDRVAQLVEVPQEQAARPVLPSEAVDVLERWRRERSEATTVARQALAPAAVLTWEDGGDSVRVDADGVMAKYSAQLDRSGPPLSRSVASGSESPVQAFTGAVLLPEAQPPVETEPAVDSPSAVDKATVALPQPVWPADDLALSQMTPSPPSLRGRNGAGLQLVCLVDSEIDTAVDVLQRSSEFTNSLWGPLPPAEVDAAPSPSKPPVGSPRPSTGQLEPALHSPYNSNAPIFGVRSREFCTAQDPELPDQIVAWSPRPAEKAAAEQPAGRPAQLDEPDLAVDRSMQTSQDGALQPDAIDGEETPPPWLLLAISAVQASAEPVHAAAESSAAVDELITSAGTLRQVAISSSESSDSEEADAAAEILEQPPMPSRQEKEASGATLIQSAHRGAAARRQAAARRTQVPAAEPAEPVQPAELAPVVRDSVPALPVAVLATGATQTDFASPPKVITRPRTPPVARLPVARPHVDASPSEIRAVDAKLLAADREMARVRKENELLRQRRRDDEQELELLKAELEGALDTDDDEEPGSASGRSTEDAIPAGLNVLNEDRDINGLFEGAPEQLLVAQGKALLNASRVAREKMLANTSTAHAYSYGQGAGNDPVESDTIVQLLKAQILDLDRELMET